MTDRNTPDEQTLKHWMDDALETARMAMDRGEAPIGAVLYDTSQTLPGKRVARGWNQRLSTGDITRHAEIVALANASQPGQEIAEGLTLVCTLEPCVMCLGAAMEAKVGRVVYGLEAPSNGGSARVDDPERCPPIHSGIERDPCRELFVEWLEENERHAGAEFVTKLLEQT